MESKIQPILALMSRYLELAGGTMSGDLEMGSNLVKFTDVAIKRDGAGELGVYDAAGLNYETLNADDIALIGSLQFSNDAESINAPNADGDYTIINARDDGVALAEVARIAGAANPYFSTGGSQQNKFYNSGAIDLGGNISGQTDGQSISAKNADSNYLVLQARDSGVGQVEIARMVGAADPYFALAGSQEFKFYNSGYADFDGIINLNEDLRFNTDAKDFSAPNTDATYTIIKARDSGVGRVEIARMVGAADPYFSLGGIQQFKFYNSGYATIGGNVNIGDTFGLQTDVNAGDYLVINAYNTNDSARKEAIRVLNPAGAGETAKLGFFGATPIIKQVNADFANNPNTGDGDTDDLITNIRNALINFGLVASA